MQSCINIDSGILRTAVRLKNTIHKVAIVTVRLQFQNVLVSCAPIVAKAMATHGNRP